MKMRKVGYVAMAICASLALARCGEDESPTTPDTGVVDKGDTGTGTTADTGTSTSGDTGVEPGTDAGPLPEVTENTEALCSDGKDNDNSGLSDCADMNCCNAGVPAQGVTSCATGTCIGPGNPDGQITHETNNALCEDGQDNDKSGKTDCDDWGCCKYGVPTAGITVCQAGTCGGGYKPDAGPDLGYDAGEITENTDELCKDGKDNDNNNHADCEDWSCCKYGVPAPGITVCQAGTCGGGAKIDAGVSIEIDDVHCGNSIDDDFDGFTDCADFSCCRNGVPANGVTVCATGTCFGPGNPERDAGPLPVKENTDELCKDGLDNDSNSHTDCDDWSCCKNGVPANGITVCQAGVCGGGTSTVDAGPTPKPDAGASIENDNAHCGNGIDDDGDNFIDCNDYSCCQNGTPAPGVTVCASGTCFGPGKPGYDAGGVTPKPDAGASVESDNAHCGNGIDDDGDNFIDCNDYSCCQNGTPAPGVTVCATGTCFGPGKPGYDAGGVTPKPDAGPSIESDDLHCGNGLDDDGDLFIDCADFSCCRNGVPTAGVTVCATGTCFGPGNPERDAGPLPVVENNDALCGDGIDNSFNGFTDCADWSCCKNGVPATGVTVCATGTCIGPGNSGDAGTPPPPVDAGTTPGEDTDGLCSDSIDNNGNGHVDCEDWSCCKYGVPATGITVCQAGTCGGGLRLDAGVSVEIDDSHCGNGLDDDFDGYVDCADFSCCRNGVPATGVTVCATGTCFGPGNPERDAGPMAVTENTDGLCSDGVDNSLNGFTDCDDWSCCKNGVPATGITVCQAGVCGFATAQPDAGTSGTSDAGVVPTPPFTCGNTATPVARTMSVLCGATTIDFSAGDFVFAGQDDSGFIYYTIDSFDGNYSLDLILLPDPTAMACGAIPFPTDTAIFALGVWDYTASTYLGISDNAGSVGSLDISGMNFNTNDGTLDIAYTCPNCSLASDTASGACTVNVTAFHDISL